MRKIFMRGLVALIPVAATIAILGWLYSFFDNLFGTPLKELLGSRYHSGMGIALAIVVVFLLGLIVNYWLFQRLYDWMERLLTKIPLVKTLYKSIRDFMQFFQGGGQSLGRVVMVTLAPDIQLLGFVTRERFDDLDKSMEGSDRIVVFIPLSYQIGGHTVLVPRANVRPVALSAEEAMRFIVSGGAIRNGGELLAPKGGKLQA